ncbi:MAG: hypothetical protein ACO1PI_08045 [Bacteroidota bacterium]|jgi:hypothetical protein
MASIKLKCLNKTENKLQLGVWIIDPELDTFIEQPYYFLQALYDAAKEKNTGEILSLNRNDLTDAEWIINNAHLYVEDVWLIDAKNYPVDESVFALEDSQYQKFWKDLDKVPYAEFELTVTDPKWVSHIKQNTTWESMAGFVG